MSGKDVKITPHIPATEPSLDAIVLHKGYPPPKQWHENAEARWYIARTRLQDLPGLSETIRRQLVQADTKRKSKETRASQRLPWPETVQRYCTFAWGDFNGEDALAQHEGIGEGTISAVRETLAKYGIGPGMKFAVFDDWMRCITYDHTIRV